MVSQSADFFFQEQADKYVVGASPLLMYFLCQGVDEEFHVGFHM